MRMMKMSVFIAGRLILGGSGGSGVSLDGMGALETLREPPGQPALGEVAATVEFVNSP